MTLLNVYVALTRQVNAHQATPNFMLALSTFFLTTKLLFFLLALDKDLKLFLKL